MIAGSESSSEGGEWNRTTDDVGRRRDKLTGRTHCGESVRIETRYGEFLIFL